MSDDVVEYAKAVTDYLADNESELSCSVNDGLRIIRRENRKIVYAENLTTGKFGFLPVYCSQAIQAPVVVGNAKLLMAIADYEAAQPGVLSFQKGTFIIGERSLDENWWFGWKGNLHGLFPFRWTRPLPMGSPTAPENPKDATTDVGNSSQLPTTVSEPHGWSLYPFHSGITNELHFDAGLLIYLLRRVDENWLEGCTPNGDTGIFPKDYVRIVVDLPDENSAHTNAIPDSQSSFSMSYDYPSEDFPPDTYAIVVSDNTLKSSDALPVQAGATVTILRKCGDQVIEAMDDFGNVGCVSMDCLEIIGSEPDEVRSQSDFRNTLHGSLESLRSSGTSLGSAQSAESFDKRLSWHDDMSCRNSPAPEAERRIVGSLRNARKLEQNGNRSASVAVPKRNKVIEEIIATEGDYISGLGVLLKEMDKSVAPQGFNKNAVLTNLREVLSAADVFLADLRRAEAQIGECFIRHIPHLKEVYIPYCENSDSAIGLLSKYKDNIELLGYMNARVMAIRDSTNCFDLASMLIKPLQRILKYPLLLSELLKATEANHPDYIFVRDALKRMSDVASGINELKRRKELVAKYRDHGTTSFTERLSRLSFHSVAKKSNRLGLLVSSAIGITTLIRDPAYQAQERKFQVNKRTIKWFVRNVVEFVEHLQGLIPVLKSISENFIALLRDSKSSIAGDYAKAQEGISSHLLNDLVPKVNAHVVVPLEETLKKFQGPSNLMTKRHAKLIDYENAKRKLERLKESQRTQSVIEEVELCKRVYQALNAQLLEDLPRFNSITCQILQSRIVAFQHYRKIFHYHCANQLLPCVTAATAGITNKKDAQKQLHLRILAILNDLQKLDFDSAFTGPSFVSVQKDEKSDGKSQPEAESVSPASSRFDQPSESSSILKRRSSSASSPTLLPVETTTSNPKQTRGALQRSNTIASSTLGKFVVRESCTARNNFDLSVKKDDVVSVIKMHDPMGNDQRWFVELNGVRGFVAKSLLQPCSARSRPLPMTPIQETKTTSPVDKTPPQTQYSFVSGFSFDSAGPYQLSLKAGERVNVLTKHDLDGNSEWWYVENCHGSRGYVPATYLKKLQEFTTVI